MDWIDYRQLPLSAGGFSALFFDYLYDYPSVASFYPGNFRDHRAFDAVLKRVAARSLDRHTLTEVLNEQNRFFGSSPKTFENIAALSLPSTFAVVTGQQVGLFGGPLYTLYKTLTTIRLAQTLETKFPGHRFVPIFWVEGEDHDFLEMNHVSVLDRENTPVPIDYLPGGVPPERNLGPVGELSFDGTLEQTLERLAAALAPTEFTAPLLARLREAYAPGRTFNQGFTAWMNHLFTDDGVIFVSPNHPRLKRLLSPLFVREVTEFPRTSQLVIDRSAELETQYHAQIKAKSINLFLFHKGGRYLIEPREHDFSLKGTRHFIQPDELLRIAQETPELLSANVILRPVAQDTLLPTVAYVAGPSEISYHAQLQPVYEHCGVVQPIIYPRASGSFIEERLERVVEKYNLDLAEFLSGEVDRLTSKVVAQIAEVQLDEMFAGVSKSVNDALNELKFGLQEVDPTLLGALEGSTGKVNTALSVLKEKASAAQKRRHEVALRQIEKAAAGLLPGGVLQERAVSPVYYLNKYGPDLLPWLRQHMDITGFKHQILPL
jgi:bacillithiol biosynthesis cysteine-adding enzyme BshC